MTRVERLLVAVALVVLPTPAVAQPAQKAPPVISAQNAPQLRAASEVQKRAYRLMRTPKPGELLTFDFSNAAEVLDATNLRSLRATGKGGQLTDITISPDGKLLAWCSRNNTAYTIEETNGGKTFDIEIGDHPGYAAFSPDSKLLAIGFTFWDPNAHGEGYSEMKLYDVTGKPIRTLERTGPGALKPVFSPDGKILAVGNRNDATQLFEVATGNRLHMLDKPMTHEIAFSPDGKTLACGYVDGTVALWDVATGQLLHEAESGCEEVYSVDWSPKGDVLATSGRGGNLVLWEPGKFKKLKELDAGFWVIQVRFTADGTRLLSASASDHAAKFDRKITIWTVPEGGR